MDARLRRDKTPQRAREHCVAGAVQGPLLRLGLVREGFQHPYEHCSHARNVNAPVAQARRRCALVHQVVTFLFSKVCG